MDAYCARLAAERPAAMAGSTMSLTRAATSASEADREPDDPGRCVRSWPRSSRSSATRTARQCLGPRGDSLAQARQGVAGESRQGFQGLAHDLGPVVGVAGRSRLEHQSLRAVKAQGVSAGLGPEGRGDVDRRRVRSGEIPLEVLHERSVDRQSGLALADGVPGVVPGVLPAPFEPLGDVAPQVLRIAGDDDRAAVDPRRRDGPPRRRGGRTSDRRTNPLQAVRPGPGPARASPRRQRCGRPPRMQATASGPRTVGHPPGGARGT